MALSSDRAGACAHEGSGDADSKNTNDSVLPMSRLVITCGGRYHMARKGSKRGLAGGTSFTIRRLPEGSHGFFLEYWRRAALI